MKTKKITEILIGSNNIGKVREIRALLPKKLRFSQQNPSIYQVPKKLEKHFYKTH